jgi:hypothetical protein
LVDRVRSNHGTLTNMDAASDWVVSGGKGALDFDATNDYVEMGVLTAIDAGDVSFSFWYYPHVVTGLATIFNNWSSTVSSRGFYCFRNGSQIAFQQPTINHRITTSVGSLTASTWHHVVCTKTSGTGGLRVHINGVLDANSGTAGTDQSSTAKFNFGGNYGGTGGPNCLMDDLIVFNASLTANEAREIYRLGRGYGVFPEPDFDEGFAAASGFKAYWARRQPQLIGGGV